MSEAASPIAAVERPTRPKRNRNPPQIYRPGDCAGWASSGMAKPGHQIASLVVKECATPNGIFKEYQTMCIRCGRSLEEIRSEYKKKNGGAD